MAFELGGLDDSLLTDIQGQIDSLNPKRTLWQKATTPIKAALGVSQNVGGQLARLVAPDLYDAAYKQSLEALAASRGVTPEQLSTLEQGEALPGLGDVITQADVFKDSAPGRIAGHVVDLGGNILGDPLTYLGGVGALSKASAISKIAKGGEAASTLSKVGKGLEAGSFAGRAITGAGEAFKAGRTGEGLLQSGKALLDAPFGPLAAAVYAPELAHGVADPAAQAYQDLKQGEGGAAVENLAKSALAASMAGLVAHGIYSDAQAARLIRDFHAPLKTPPAVQPGQIAQPTLGGDLNSTLLEPTPGMKVPSPDQTMPPTPVASLQQAAPPRSLAGGTQQALGGEGTGTGAGGAGVDPSTGAPLGGVNQQAHLDTPQLGQQGVEAPLQAVPPQAAQEALQAPQQVQAAPVSIQALPEAPEVSQTLLVPVPEQAAPASQPTLPDLSPMEQADLAGYWQARGSGAESAQDTYRGRNATGRALGLGLGHKAAVRITEAVKGARKALDAGVDPKGLKPLEKAIYLDLQGGRQAEAPRPSAAQETQATPTEAAPTQELVSRAQAPKVANPALNTPEGQALQRLFAGVVEQDQPQESGSMRITQPRMASEALRLPQEERLPAQAGPEPISKPEPVLEAPARAEAQPVIPSAENEPLRTGDIAGRVGEMGQRLGHQGEAEIKANPGTEPMLPHRYRAEAGKERGSVLAPEALRDATPTQREAITALHTGEPGRTPMDVFLARARRAISDPNVAQKAEVEIQNELEKRVLAMSKDSQPTPAQIRKAFNETVKGRVRAKAAEEASQEVPTIARSVEGADSNAQERFFQDLRINENSLIDSAEGATSVYDFLDKTAKRVKVDGKAPRQWMLDALVEVGAPPRTGNPDANVHSVYNAKLKELLDGAGQASDEFGLRRAKGALKKLSDGLQAAIDSERGKRGEAGSPEALVRRALQGPDRIPYMHEQWEGLQADPGDRNQFRFQSGKAQMYGRVIRHDVKEPFVLAVMPEGRQGQESAKSIPALEALAAEAAKHGETELHVNWDWFGTNKERYKTLLEHDPQSPVKLTQLPSKDPEYLRLGITPQEAPKPEGTGPKTPKLASFAKLRDAAEAARARLDQRSQALSEQIKKGGSQSGAAPNLAADLHDYAIIAANAIAQKGVQFAEWAKELPAHLQEHAQAIWAKAQEHLAARRTGAEAELAAKPTQAPATLPETPQRVVKPILEKAAETPTPQRPGAEAYLKQHAEVLPKDVAEVGTELGQTLYKHLNQQHRQKWATVTKEAFSRITEDSPEDFQAKLKLVGVEDPKAVQELAAVRNKLVKAHQEAKENYFQALADGDPNKTQKAQQAYIEQAYKTSQAVNAAANDVDNTTRAIRVKNILQEADLKDPRLGKLQASLKRMLQTDDKLSGAEADQVSNLLVERFKQGDYQGVLDATKKFNKASYGDMALEFYKSSLLGPASHAAMGVSNTLFEGLRTVERSLGASLDKALTAAGIQGERQYVHPAVGMLAHAKKTALREGWQQMAGDILSIAKAEGLKIRPEDFLTSAENDFKFLHQGAIPGKIGELIRNTMKGASALDRYAKIQAKHTEAMWAGYNAAFKEGHRGPALEKAAYANYQDIVSKAMDFHSPEHVKELGKWKKAVSQIYDEMDTDTFQSQLDPSTLLGATSRVLGKHKLTALIVPFRTTPANVFLETVKRTPLGFLGAAKRAREKGVPLSKELIKPLVGTAMMGMLYTMAEGGDLTGSGPIDPEQNQALKSTGWQPYSLRLGKDFVSYQRLEPVSSLFGIAADAAEGMRRGDFKSVGSTLQRGAALIAENLTNKTFMQGLEGAFTAYSDPERYGPRFIKNIVSSLVPNTIAGVPFGVAAKALDPTYRQTDLSTAAEAKIPFLSENLPAQTDATGEVRQRPGSALERLFSPFNRSTLKESAAANVAGEMDRIGATVRPPRRFENIGGQHVEYTAQEYKRLQEAQQEATKRMANIIRDPTYQALPDNEDDPRYQLGRKTKADVLRRVYGQFLRPIKQQLAPRLQREARQTLRQRRSEASA